MYLNSGRKGEAAPLVIEVLPLAIDTVLFQLGPFHIYAYGFMLSVGYGAGIILALRGGPPARLSRQSRTGLSRECIYRRTLDGEVFLRSYRAPYFLAFPKICSNIGNGLSPSVLSWALDW